MPSRISIARRIVSSASHAVGPGHHDRQVGRAAPRCSPTSPSSTGTTGCGRRRSSAARRRRSNIGSANDVGRAHSKPIPSSQETSTNSVPGRKRPRSSFIDEHQRRVGVLQDAVDDDVVLGQDLDERRELAAARGRACGSGSRGSRVEVHASAPSANGAATADTGRWVSTVTSLTPSADSARDRAARGGAEADHRGAQAAAVVAGDPEQLQRVQDRAVAGQLVVLVEDVDAEVAVRASSGSSPPRRSASARRSMASWVISRSCTQCGQPQTTWPGRSVCEVLGQRLGQQDHVALREAAPRASAARRPAARAARRRTPKPLAVAVLEEHPRAQLGVDALDVRGMDRQPALVGLARRRDDAEGQSGPPGRVYGRPVALRGVKLHHRGKGVPAPARIPGALALDRATLSGLGRMDLKPDKSPAASGRRARTPRALTAAHSFPR